MIIYKIDWLSACLHACVMLHGGHRIHSLEKMIEKKKNNVLRYDE